MAQTAHLTLWNENDDGSKGAQIKGESTQLSDNRADTIECVSFVSSVTTPVDSGLGKATGKRQFTPIKVRKRVDKSSTELVKALTENRKLQGKFDFFRPAGDGNDEAFYSVFIKSAFITNISLVLPDTMENPGASNIELYEDVSFMFDPISWTFTSGSSTTEHSDSWSGKHK